jgi:hypothetical protein
LGGIAVWLDIINAFDYGWIITGHRVCVSLGTFYIFYLRMDKRKEKEKTIERQVEGNNEVLL